MSKLDGNGRWSTKMMLTEHVEQLVEQQQPKESKIITTEERTMVRDYLLLPYMEKMVQKSVSDIEHSTNILKRLYLMAGQHVLRQITTDMYRFRREFKQRNIKILNEEQSDFVVYHHINCRGYTERFGMKDIISVSRE